MCDSTPSASALLSREAQHPSIESNAAPVLATSPSYLHSKIGPMERLKCNPTWIYAAAFVGCVAVLPAQHALASGAFAVDDADVDQPGQCKVESWLSTADNRDR